MKEICFLIGNLDNSGGTERVTSIIANELSNSGYNITILSLVNGLNPFFELSEKIEVCSLYSEKISFKKQFLNTVLKIRGFVKEHSIGTLIVVDTISCLFTVPALLGTKVNHICWEHFNFNSDLGKKERSFARQLAARYCNTVVTLTQRDRGYWLIGTKHKANIIPIPNPSPFPVQNNDQINTSKVVLAVGRLTHQKGFDLLLQSWSLVTLSVPDWKLIIVGEGEDQTRLTECIDKYNLSATVYLVGSTDNVAQYYNQANIYCLSSRFEGFPMVLLETLSFGLSVVSFDCDTGPAEILAGTGSILVPPENIQELANSLIIMMKDDNRRKEIAINSRKKAKHYQIENIIPHWISIIEN